MKPDKIYEGDLERAQWAMLRKMWDDILIAVGNRSRKEDQ